MTEEELRALEARHPTGVTAAVVVESLGAMGVHFTEASLRKWVQLELLPKSERVGHRGALGGSQGLYPVSVLRRVIEIKRLLADGLSIEEIRSRGLLFENDLEDLERRLERVLGALDQGVKGQRDEVAAEQVRRELREARALSSTLIGRLRSVRSRMKVSGERVRAAG